jgi:ribosomal protein S18 acetylase RimI-like enzyme
VIVRSFQEEDRAAVIDLWRRSGLIVSWNDPGADIDRKLQVQPELFLVGVETDMIVGTVMGGYDGHRGWVYYLAVAPEFRRRGYARLLLDRVSKLLRDMGCAKLNIMIRSTNQEVRAFYQRLGFTEEDVVCCGKRFKE